MKKLLLASSLVALGFLVASGLSENVFVSWKGYQKEYARLLAERAENPARKREALATAVELRQVVVPDLHVIDRCVTCHLGLDDPRMAGAPNPYAAHPGNILKIHPPEKFGCTICHRGQGAAVSFREAKAVDVYWDYPLLPPDLVESSCGICHDPMALAERGAPALARGARLFEEKGCHGCHRLGGLGGSLGAELDSVGLKTKHQLVMANLPGERTTYRWLDRHFKDPQGIVPGSLMKPDYPTEEEARALTIYMLSLQAGRELPDRAVARDRHRLLSLEHDQGERDGRTLYDRLCRVCHGEGTFGTYDKFLGRFVPAIRNPAFLRMADREFLRASIMRGRPGTQMAGFDGGMTDADLAKLLEYLAGSERIPERRPDSYEKLPVGDAKRGGSIFARQCAGCHDPGEKGQVAPTLSSRSFQEKASDAMILRTIAEGRPGTAMVAFVGAEGTGFTGGELADLLAYLRTLSSRRR
ncbi:MAG: c-type cytochrome [Candidatus Deferrimicrobiaceae bacterium]